ncbi:MAG: DNA polymerase III subunit chi [Kiloniellales bacterium]
MTEVRFYHLTRTPLEVALPQMLERTLERGQRAVVQAGSPERVEALNNLLWTYNDHSFLPHGSAADGFAAEQPIWLTAEDELPNRANVLFLTDGVRSSLVEKVDLCAVLFDGGNDAAVSDARAYWRTLQGASHALTYWQQDEAGRWKESA